MNVYDQRPDPSYGTGAIVNIAKVSPMPKAGEALAVLEGYTWPGNVRELEQTVSRGVIFAGNGYIKGLPPGSAVLQHAA